MKDLKQEMIDSIESGDLKRVKKISKLINEVDYHDSEFYEHGTNFCIMSSILGHKEILKHLLNNVYDDAVFDAREESFKAACIAKQYDIVKFLRKTTYLNIQFLFEIYSILFCMNGLTDEINYISRLIKEFPHKFKKEYDLMERINHIEKHCKLGFSNGIPALIESENSIKEYIESMDYEIVFPPGIFNIKTSKTFKEFYEKLKEIKKLIVKSTLKSGVI